MIAVFALAALAAPTTLELSRGAPLPGLDYWAVEDTYLDAKDPELNFGGSYTLLGGKGRTLLIRFGDLERAVGKHRHVVRARLFLTPSGGEMPQLAQASRLLSRWGEGPATSLPAILRARTEAEAATKDAKKIGPPKNAATYRQRLAGSADWQEPGAGGPSDAAPIAGAHLVAQPKEVAIEGMEAAVQQMLDHPVANHGFALTFLSDTEFLSSESSVGRPRLEIETEPDGTAAGADLAVVQIETQPTMPKPGDQVSYTAHVLNLGTERAKPFSTEWSADDRASATNDVDVSLNPGQETTVKFSHGYRSGSVSLRILPSGPDAVPSNNAMEIEPSAVPVDVLVDKTDPKLLGTEADSARTFAQRQIQIWNETVAPHSRFSFAPEGVLAHIRLGSIQMGTGTGIPIDKALPVDAVDTDFLRRVAVSLGAPDGRAMNLTPGKIDLAQLGTRASEDRFPGLMGYGDTRFEGTLPGFVAVPYEPDASPVYETSHLDPTDLLCATAVAAINDRLNPVVPHPVGLNAMPKTVLLRVTDLIGRPLIGLDVEFYRSMNGRIAAGNPAFVSKTDDGGRIALSTNPDSGPFANMASDGSNGVFLLRSQAGGVTECGWLKAWQITDAYRRGSVAAAVMDVRLNLPSAALVLNQDLASDRAMSDSADSPPAALLPLADGKYAVDVALPARAGGWVEIDLGRDRTIGEVVLVGRKAPFWSKFDIVGYSTGQRPEEGAVYAKELDWDWTSRNRSDTADFPTVAYRGGLQRVRYVRIVNRSGTPGVLGGIKIHAAKLSP